jgi:broad specificity phosphatase PhoE
MSTGGEGSWQGADERAAHTQAQANAQALPLAQAQPQPQQQPLHQQQQQQQHQHARTAVVVGGAGGLGTPSHASVPTPLSATAQTSGYSSSPASVATPGPMRPLAYCFSAEHAKIVHLCRHGQGAHNVAAALYGAAAYKDVTLTDARLDATGRAQATALGARMREARLQVDVVLVSPMTRTLETATHMFRGDTRAAMVAIEMCREAHGGHPCDQRRAVAALRPEFPHVDFSLVTTDADTWHNPDRRETVKEVAVRCDKFLDILRRRPERNIVVVSHGVFLETLLNRCGLLCPEEHVRDRRFENAEMRSIVMGGWLA